MYLKKTVPIVDFLVLMIGFQAIYASPKTKKPANGILVIVTDPAGASIALLNGTKLTSPATLKAGTYTVVAKKNGFYDEADIVTVKPGKTTKIKLELGSRIEPTNTSVPEIIGRLPFENKYFYAKYDWEKRQIFIIPTFDDFKMGENPNDKMAKEWPTYERNAKAALCWFNANGLSKARMKVKGISLEWYNREWWPEGKKISY